MWRGRGSGEEMKKHEAVEGERELKREGGSWASSRLASGLSPAEGTVFPVSFLKGKRMWGAACGHTNGHLPCVEGSEWGQWNRGWGGTRKPSETFESRLSLGHQLTCLFMFSFNSLMTSQHTPFSSPALWLLPHPLLPGWFYAKDGKYHHCPFQPLRCHHFLVTLPCRLYNMPPTVQFSRVHWVTR